MPTIDILNKICPHCGGTKWFLIYQTYKDKVYTIYNCRLKVDERNKKWNDKNKEKRCLIYKRSRDKVKHTQDYIAKNRKRAAEYYKKYPEKVYAHSKINRIKNPEKYNLYSKLKKMKYVETAADPYIKSLICQDNNLSYKDVPQELIKIKRKQLLLKRKIKNNGKN